jgi:EAL domain-containing protein (putative c-di-GMP-specific phosphodiesterase class I)
LRWRNRLFGDILRLARLEEASLGSRVLADNPRPEEFDDTRDWWLRRQDQVQRVVWEFSRSDVTGEIGATKSLLEKLKKLGVDVIIND